MKVFMNFKKIFLSLVLTSLLITPSIANERPAWMIELPRVMCLKNKLWIVWPNSQYAVQVTGIFCSLSEDLV